MRKFLRLLSPALSVFFCAVVAAGAEPEAKSSAALPKHTNAFTGDFDGMLGRRMLRILVPYSKTLYFVDRGKQMGIVAELARALEADINKRLGFKTLGFHVVLLPAPRERLIPMLIEGKGDIVAGNLTITPQRAALVDFAPPWMEDAREIVVTGPAAPKLEKLDDLAGREIYVRASSSYATHLAALNADFAKRGQKPIAIKPADENLEDEDLLDMTHSGLLPFVVVDEHKARLWAEIFGALDVRSDLVVSHDGAIAWAMRKNSPRLRAELEPFIASHKLGTTFGNIIKQRYFSNTQLVKNAYADKARASFVTLENIFRKYGETYGFEFLLLAAQGYQESQLDQHKRSPAGAVGIMQIKPSTAAGKPIGVTGVDRDADANIHAGAAYLRHMADVYLDDPNLSPRNRMLMAFAAYNAGPGNLKKFRKSAEAQGLDPNVWFNNVEQGAAKVVGRETVQYVSNIYKYFVAYALLEEQAKRGDKAREDAVK